MALPQATVDNNVEKGYYIHSKKLGQGGFGTVKLATHLLTKQQVAIKIIDKEKVKKDLFRVGTEIAALQVLRHNNIAKLLQVIHSEQFIYLVLEYCSGGELFDHLIRHRRLPESEAKTMIRSLVLVLGYIHGKGFAHRDIKPENILLDSAGNIKLIDFGLAANSHSMPSGTLEGLTTACGSPAYVCPELLAGVGYNGPAADVWSTGVLMYTLLTGNLPFFDNNLPVLYKKIRSASFMIPRDLNLNAKDLLCKMMCKDPSARITVEQILAHPWLSPSFKSNFNQDLPLSGAVEPEISDHILLKCAALLGNFNLNELRHKVMKTCGYETATYWLVNSNPAHFKDVECFSDKSVLNRSLSLPACDSPSAQTTNPLKRKSETENEQPNRPAPFKIPCSETKSARLPLKMTENSGRTPARASIAKKLFKCEESTPGTPTAIIGKQSKAAPNVLPLTPHPFAITSRAQKACVNNRLFKQSETPVKTKSADNRIPDETPKKSLFKKFLESATPRKATMPRYVAMNECHTQKIIVTTFTDIEKCKEAIQHAMAAKRVNCKVNNFSIRCVLSALSVIIVGLEVELVVCRENGLVGYKTRRISGSAMDYVRLCEELMKAMKKAA